MVLVIVARGIVRAAAVLWGFRFAEHNMFVRALLCLWGALF